MQFSCSYKYLKTFKNMYWCNRTLNSSISFGAVLVGVVGGEENGIVKQKKEVGLQKTNQKSLMRHKIKKVNCTCMDGHKFTMFYKVNGHDMHDMYINIRYTYMYLIYLTYLKHRTEVMNAKPRHCVYASPISLIN